MNSIQLGNLGEVIVLKEFLNHGIQCYLPYGDGSRVDLIADFNGKLNKIQIKCCEQSNGDTMTWKVGGGSQHKIYNKDEIDYFALCCVEEQIVCLVPFSEQRSSITIRKRETKDIRYNTHFCDEYSLDKLLKG